MYRRPTLPLSWRPPAVPGCACLTGSRVRRGARSPTFRFQAGYIPSWQGVAGVLSPLLSVAVDGVRGVPWMTSGQQSFDPGQALVELGEDYLAPVSRGGQRRNAATRVHLPSSPRHQAGTSVAARRPRTGRYEYRHHSRPTLVAGVNNRRYARCHKRPSCVLITVRDSMSGRRCHRSSLRTSWSQRCADDG